MALRLRVKALRTLVGLKKAARSTACPSRKSIRSTLFQDTRRPPIVAWKVISMKSTSPVALQRATVA